LNETFSKILSMLAIVAIGYALKFFGVLKREDFRILSDILIHVTFPAAIIVNFDGFIIKPEMAFIPFLCIGGFFCSSALVYLVTRRSSPQEKAFVLLNSTAYNTGGFSLAFVQTLLPAESVVAFSLFDIGNSPCASVFCNVFASTAAGQNKKITPKFVFSQLVHSFPFMFYFIITVKCLLQLPTPEFILVPAKLIAPANVVFAMLSVGVGMEFHFPKDQVAMLAKCMLIRYSMAIPLALICWYLLPFGLYVRLALVIVSFSPSTLFGAFFTEKLGGNYALANTAISTSIIISTIILTILTVSLI